MVFSYYIKYPFYNLIWYILKIIRKKKLNILYCDSSFDITLYKNVGKHLSDIKIVAKNKKVREELKAMGYKNISLLPSFPDSVIMFRNMAWRFPCKKIIKIGFKHGAYNFKRHSKAQYYDMFNLFFLTSSSEVEIVRKLGVKTELDVAYPKVDSLFDGSITEDDLKILSGLIGLDKTKKTLFFSSTWDGSGMSAIDEWYDKLSLLKDKYNILVTVHDWMNNKYKVALKSNKDIFFIEEIDRLKYIMLSDICICDTSSLIAEICLLGKPLITFKVKNTPRTLMDTVKMIDKISISITHFEELDKAIEKFISNPDLLKNERSEVCKVMFDKPDGQSGKRAAERIKCLLMK